VSIVTVHSPPDLVATWPARAASVAAVRAQLQMCLRRWDLSVLEDTGAVVLSELATNAVTHAGTEFTVTLSRMTDGVLIRVNDGAAGAPVTVRSQDVLAADGRGMHLVDALTAGWGIVPDGRGGKAVWALMAAG
jgi:anti-sigma regulatory factor (Ser/Thr protein kinase)